MVVLVFLTNIPALLADLSAQAADVFGKVATARHGAGGQMADLRAVDICANTVRHFSHVSLAEARGSAMVAGGGTGAAGIDATGVLMM